MSFNFGGSSKNDRGTQTTTLQMPEASADEVELRQINLAFAKKQMERLDAADKADAEFRNSSLGKMQSQVEEKATANLLARLTGQAPVLSPEEQARLDTIYGTASQRGMEDLTEFGRNLASTRGMSVSDSPIGGDMLEQGRKFQEGLTAQRAASSLDLGNASADFNARLAAFQNQLRQQAYMNRLASAATSPASFGMQSSLFGERLNQAGRTGAFSGRSTGSQFGTGFDLGSLAMGAGGAMRGYGSLSGSGGGWGYM